MSIWQFTAAIGGWVKANTTQTDTLNREEAAELADFLDRVEA